MPILQEQKIGYVPGWTADNGCCVIGKVRLRQKSRFLRSLLTYLVSLSDKICHFDAAWQSIAIFAKIENCFIKTISPKLF